MGEKMAGGMAGAQLPIGTVTFLFSDIEESTGLLRHVGDDTFASIRGIHRRLMREAVLAHEGTEIETTGDGFFIAFASARSAVRAAVAAQLTFASFEWPTAGQVRVRMGLHTAEPHLSEDGYVGVGVHRAARICEAARGGQILVSNATAGIIEDAELTDVELLDLGEHRLKGLPWSQRLFQLSVLTLPSKFDPPRTADLDARVPGVGTFFATDVAGWRDIVRLLGDEATAALLTEYHRSVAKAVEAHDGVVLEEIGDNLWAVFRNARDAIQTAATVRDTFSDFAWPSDCDVALKIALHSGRWSGDPREPAGGTAFLRLNRLAEVVEPNQVLISQTTADLLEGDRGVPPLRNRADLELRDFDEPVRVYELAGST
jgi:class 3 adenylate cyclase